MHYPPDELARRDQQDQSRERYVNRQMFKLVYILFFAFGMPAIIIGSAAIFLAIYDPDALRKAVRSKPQQAVDKLDSPTYFVREEALKALVAGTPDRSRRDVAEKIKKRLTDSHWPVQELAIDSLGDWGQSEDAAALEDLVKDRMSTFIRPRICKTLGKLKGDAALELLILVLGMGGSDREHAVEAIRQFGPDAEDGLIAHNEPAERAGICAALKAVGTSKSVPYLEAAAQDENPQTAESAKQALSAVKQRGEKP